MLVRIDYGCRTSEHVKHSSVSTFKHPLHTRIVKANSVIATTTTTTANETHMLASTSTSTLYPLSLSLSEPSLSVLEMKNGLPRVVLLIASVVEQQFT